MSSESVHPVRPELQDDAVLVFDADSGTTWANPGAIAWMGFDPAGLSRDEVEQRLALAHPEGKLLVRGEGPLSRVLRGEAVNGVRLTTQRGGQRIEAEMSATPLLAAGRIHGAVIIWRAPVERVRAALRASEDKFARVFYGTAAAMSITRLADGRFLEVNDRHLEATRHTRAELLGNTTLGARIWKDPKDREAFIRELKRSGYVRNLECQFARSDGEEWTGLLSSELTELDGEQVIINSLLDITDRIRAEQALRAADRNKNQFIAVLSHELRNPLGPIRNSLYILDHAAPGGEQAARAQAVIQRQVDHMARLVDDLLDVTRISRGKVHLEAEDLELRDVIRRTIEDFRAGLETAGVQLEVSLPETLPVHGDRTRLAQIVGNLLHNAGKFTYRGGRVAISAERDRVHEQAIIRVRDDGVGISSEMLPRLFAAFSQADSTLDRSRGGLGLGLALVKGLVELHGGTVAARSDGPGRGAELTVRIPLRTRETRPEVPGRTPAERRPRRVLVVEDNVDGADSLREALELSAHEVQVAYDGPAGLELAHAFHPEVVICDLALPGMSGYEVARALRADASLSGVVLVALSGYGMPEDLERAAQAGFHHHLSKPADMAKLEELLG
jgi:PAS domain S-box-containing protein